MSALEVALTVLVYGAVASGALFTIMGLAWISAHTELLKARATSERRLH